MSNTIKTYAIIDSQDQIINTVLWNGDLNTWQPPAGTTAVLLDEATNAKTIKEKYTADQWLAKCGYNSMQLVTLLDLELKLANLNKVSQKMLAVRQWLNLILTNFSLDNSSSENWPLPPCSFEEATQDALSKLV